MIIKLIFVHLSIIFEVDIEQRCQLKILLNPEISGFLDPRPGDFSHAEICTKTYQKVAPRQELS
jgi:hypothetical protein